MTTALLHPGIMGASLGRALRAARPNELVLWVAEGRSVDTRSRAADAGLTEVGSLAEAVDAADLIISVCPPTFAVDVAEAVAAQGFNGIYVDANAIAPQTARRIGSGFSNFVDGGIVGSPVSGPGSTRLYVSGLGAQVVASRFEGSDLEVRLVEGAAGAASAVKMCFAAWTKGTSALLLAVRGLAEAEGVTRELLGEWETSMQDLGPRSSGIAGAVGPKAWRFEGEMYEIADAFASVGLPSGFHVAAADIYHRLAQLRGRPPDGEGAATVAEALALLLVDPSEATA